jgi:methyl-accepting chemotaxis protein
MKLNLNHMKISTRLSLSFALVLSITALIAAVGIARLDTLKTANHEIATTGAARSALAKQWMANIQLNSLRLSVALKSSDAATIESLQRDIKVTTTATSDIQKTLGALKHDATGQRLLAEIAAIRTRYLDTRAALSARKQAGVDVAQAVDREMDPIAAEFLAALGRLVEHAESQLRQGEAEVNAMAAASQWLLGLGALAALLMDLLFGATIVRSIVRQLGAEPGDAARLAQGVAGGDLGMPIQLRPGDTTSLMVQLKAMQASLVEVVGNVRRNSESVATASAQIAQGNNDLSSRTEQQASALEQTAASMQELSATVKQNADSARHANQLALDASAVAVRGGEVVGQVVATMKHINDASHRIADIIGVIDGIAFQTNILALNAAVEAARAGEQGRGFAVVATEVRSLAGRSAEAAREIKGLIGASVERVEQGTALVDQAGSTMTEVVAAIQRVAGIVGQISAASAEQSAGVAQVGEAIGQMDRATQQNAALVEESAAAAESLRQQAHQLVQSVAVFTLGTAQPA